MAEGNRHESHVHGGALAGPLWFGGWLFTIGFLKLAVGKAILALIIWPYYLGATFHLPK